jgi:biotin carboxyl carrier protein
MKTYQYKVKGVDYEVEIAEVEGNIAKVNVNGIPFEVEMQKPINAAKHPSMSRPKVEAPKTPATAPQPAAPVAQPATTATSATTAGTPIKAPLPGTITDIKVAVGQQVNVGDTVVVLEAMKMQNNIESDYAGKVLALNVNKGDTVMEGTVMLTIG